MRPTRTVSTIGCACALLALVLVCTASDARASDEDDAKAAVAHFNARFDKDEIRPLYAEYAGDFMRDKVTEEAFVATLAIMRSQSGPARSRTLIQQQTVPDPATSQPIINFRYRVQFVAFAAYQDISMIKVGAGQWKLYGIYFAPAPP
jgi:hypothetical protein